MRSFYSLKQLAEEIGLHTRTIREWVAKGKFPEPVFLPNGQKRWLGEDVMKWKYGLKTTPPEKPVKRNSGVT